MGDGALPVTIEDSPITAPTDRSNCPQVSGRIDASAATARTASLPKMLRMLAAARKVAPVEE
jgi:hypothetical protein